MRNVNITGNSQRNLTNSNNNFSSFITSKEVSLSIDKENINHQTTNINSSSGELREKKVSSHNLKKSSPIEPLKKKVRRNSTRSAISDNCNVTQTCAFNNNTPVQSLSTNMNTSMKNDNLSRSRNNAEEDFSFAKLKGAVKKFEQVQKEHHKSHQFSSSLLNSNATLNTSASSLALTSASSFGTTDSGSIITASTTPMSAGDEESSQSPKKRSFGKASNDNKENSNNILQPPTHIRTSTVTTQSANNDIKASNVDEDFSFQKLKQKALGMEKAAGSNVIPNGFLVLDKMKSQSNKQRMSKKEEENEDFSFQTLKEKALKGPSTPVRKPVNRSASNSRSCSRSRDTTRTSNPRVVIAPHTVCGKTRCPLVPPISHYNSSTSSTTSYIRSNSTPKKRIQSKGSFDGGRKIPTIPLTETKKKVSSSSLSSTSFDPSRFQFKPKIKREEVQATNDTIASVSKLSKWLADDPFEKKKQLLIRKGEQIANKSRAFEHEELVNGSCRGGLGRESRAQRERQYFPDGKVSQNKDWLQNAFGDSGKNEEEDCPENLGILEKRKMLESAFKKKSGLR